MVTKFEEFDAALFEERKKQEEEKLAAEQKAAAEKGADKGKKGGAGKEKETPKDAKGAAKPGGTPGIFTPGEFPAFDPSDPNKHKVTPDCASIELSTITTMSELLSYFVHANNLGEEH